LHDIEILENALEIYWNKKRTPHTLKYITDNYSIFDFLLGLGQYFQAHKAFHQYNLTDVYDIINAYAAEYYPDDTVLKELIGIDYYLFYKVKPKPLFLKEIDNTEKFPLLARHHLNPHKYRYLVFPIGFDFNIFKKENRIEKHDTHIIIQYTGVDKAAIIALNSLVTEGVID
jgi:hypothetical protein